MHIMATSCPDQVNTPMKTKEAPAAKLISIKWHVGYQEAGASQKKDKMVIDKVGANSQYQNACQQRLHGALEGYRCLAMATLLACTIPITC